MDQVTGKYLMIKEATSFFRAVGEAYQIWLEYQVSKGVVLVRPDYIKPNGKNAVCCILTRPMRAYEWCKIANSLTAQGYSPILINVKDLK